MRRVRRNKRPRSTSAGTIANPTIAIVGAGRVGCALGRRLHEKGWRIGPVITRSMRSAREARRRIGSGTPQAGVSEAVLAADVILICHARPRHRRYRRSTGAAWRIQSFCRRAGGEAPKEVSRQTLARQGRFAYQRRAGQRCFEAPGASRRRNRVLASFADVQRAARSLCWLVRFA